MNESPPLSLLSRREQQVFALVAEGHPLKEVGRRLFISDKTVATHKAHIKMKLNIKTPVEWMALLRQIPKAAA